MRRKWMHWLSGYRFTDLTELHLDILLQHAIETKNAALFGVVARTCKYTQRHAKEYILNMRRPHMGDSNEWPDALHDSLHDKKSWAFARCWNCALKVAATRRNANVLDCKDNTNKTVLLCDYCNRKFSQFYYCIARPKTSKSVFVCGRNPYSTIETRDVLDGLSNMRLRLCHYQTWTHSQSGQRRKILTVVVEFLILGCTRRYRLCMPMSRIHAIFGTYKPRIGTLATQPMSVLCLDKTFANNGNYGIYVWKDICAFAQRIRKLHMQSSSLCTNRKAIHTPQKIPDCDHPPTSTSLWHLQSCSACGYTNCERSSP